MLYAILHLPTSKFLPRSKYKRGGTHVELDSMQPPRLFSNRVAAKNALRYWLNGALDRKSSFDISGDDHEWLIRTPKPHRKADEMRIVAVKLVITD